MNKFTQYLLDDWSRFGVAVATVASLGLGIGAINDQIDNKNHCGSCPDSAAISATTEDIRARWSECMNEASMSERGKENSRLEMLLLYAWIGAMGLGVGYAMKIKDEKENV